jgi:hypothetical protein
MANVKVDANDIAALAQLLKAMESYPSSVLEVVGKVALPIVRQWADQFKSEESDA